LASWALPAQPDPKARPVALEQQAHKDCRASLSPGRRAQLVRSDHQD